MPNFHVGFVIFPGLTQLDFTGPLQVLARLPESTIHIVAKSQRQCQAIAGSAWFPRARLRPARRST